MAKKSFLQGKFFSSETFGWKGTLSRQKIEHRLAQWEKNIACAAWKTSASPLLSHMRRMQRLLKKKGYPHPDDFFFSIEDLPYFGKEYWFLHFVVPGRDEQMIITAGRSQGQVSVNKKSVNKVSRAAEEGVKFADCAAVCWLYCGKKEVLIDSIGEVGVKNKAGGHRLTFCKGKNGLAMEGAYPSFRIRLKKGKKGIFSAQARARKIGAPWEMPHFLENPLTKGFGALMVNYFFDFEGRMYGKKLNGTAYLQKVVATMPLAPWNWVRVQFKNGAVLDFFTAKPLGDIKPKVHIWSNGFVELQGRRVKLSNLKLSSFMSGHKKRWVLSGKGLFLSMESYSLQRFSMKQNTQFQYDEYLVRAKDFSLRIGKKEYTLKELGQASGIVEDAYGYLL